MQEWFLIRDGERRGPFSLQELADHHVERDTLVWREGMMDWVAVADLPELAPVLRRTPPRVPVPPPVPSAIAAVGSVQPSPSAEKGASSKAARPRTLTLVAMGLLVCVLVAGALWWGAVDHPRPGSASTDLVLGDEHVTTVESVACSERYEMQLLSSLAKSARRGREDGAEMFEAAVKEDIAGGSCVVLPTGVGVTIHATEAAPTDWKGDNPAPVASVLVTSGPLEGRTLWVVADAIATGGNPAGGIVPAPPRQQGVAPELSAAPGRAPAPLADPGSMASPGSAKSPVDTATMEDARSALTAALLAQSGRHYSDFIEAPSMDRYAVEKIGLDATQSARFAACMEVELGSSIVSESGVTALVFQGCKAHSCGSEDSVLAIDVADGDFLVGVRDEQGSAILRPSERLRALLVQTRHDLQWIPDGTVATPRAGGQLPIPTAEASAASAGVRLAASEPIAITSEMLPPELVKRIEPDFPLMAKRSGSQGDVVLSCIIDDQGNVTIDEVTTPVEGLTEAAVAAVRQWKYRPAQLQGHPQAVFLTVTVQFRLPGAGAPR